MSLRFLCRNCKGLLKTGRRKIGTEVECPKCGTSTRVPTEQAAAAELAMARGSRGGSSEGSPLSEFVVYDFDNEHADNGYESGSSQPAAATSWPKPGRWSQAAPARPGLAGNSYVLVKRRALYVQAALYAVVGLMFLAAGVLIGVGLESSRGESTDGDGDESPAGTAGGGEAFTWSFEFAYTDESGQAQADEGAVVLALPVGRARARFDGAALAAGGPAPPQATLLALAYVGGAHARADAFGRAELRLPRPGKYTLLFLSSHVARGTDESAEEAVAALERFFPDAADLLGERRVRAEQRELSPPAKEEQVHFGPVE